MASPQFLCGSCQMSGNANASLSAGNLLINPNYFPAGFGDRVTHWLQKDLLLDYHELIRGGNGFSAKVFCEALHERTLRGGRTGRLDEKIFSDASQRFANLRMEIQRQNVESFECPSCAGMSGHKLCEKNPSCVKSFHSDANHTLFRDHYGGDVSTAPNPQPAYWENDVIIADKYVASFRGKVKALEKAEAQKEKAEAQKGKKHRRVPSSATNLVTHTSSDPPDDLQKSPAVPPACGANYKAFNQTGGGKRESKDETGLELACCPHLIIYRCANMYKGESFEKSLLLQLHMRGLGFTCLCKDNACKYYKYSLDRTKLLYDNQTCIEGYNNGNVLVPDLHAVTSMDVVLSRFHAQSHGPYCKCLYGVEYVEGLGLPDGEYAERVFSHMSCSSKFVSKMTKSHRNDFMTTYMGSMNDSNVSAQASFVVKQFKKVVSQYRASQKGYETQRKLYSDFNESMLGDLKEKLQELAEGFQNGRHPATEREETSLVFKAYQQLEVILLQVLRSPTHLGALLGNYDWTPKALVSMLLRRAPSEKEQDANQDLSQNREVSQTAVHDLASHLLTEGVMTMRSRIETCILEIRDVQSVQQSLRLKQKKRRVALEHKFSRLKVEYQNLCELHDYAVESRHASMSSTLDFLCEEHRGTSEVSVQPMSDENRSCPQCVYKYVGVKNGDAISFDNLPWITGGSPTSAPNATGSIASATDYEKRRLVESWLLMQRLEEQIGIVQHQAEHYLMYYLEKCQSVLKTLPSASWTCTHGDLCSRKFCAAPGFSTQSLHIRSLGYFHRQLLLGWYHFRISGMFIDEDLMSTVTSFLCSMCPLDGDECNRVVSSRPDWSQEVDDIEDEEAEAEGDAVYDHCFRDPVVNLSETDAVPSFDSEFVSDNGSDSDDEA